MDVAAWLRNLQLERYELVFRDNAIDAEVLPELSEADLEKLGVVLGHRKKLLVAIQALRQEESQLQDARGPPSQTRICEPGPAPAASIERRQLTVMFVDLVGSTALSSRLDPEEMHEVIRSYQNAVAGEIVRLEGHVQFMGDGVLAYFGWPQAHEDEAERAVRAALGILGVLPALATPAKQMLLARIGIATGLVVVGDIVGEGAAPGNEQLWATPRI